MHETVPTTTPTIEQRLELLEKARQLGVQRVCGFWQDGGALILEMHPDGDPWEAMAMLEHLPPGSVLVTGVTAHLPDTDRMRVLLDKLQARAGELADPRLLADAVELSELVTAELLEQRLYTGPDA